MYGILRLLWPYIMSYGWTRLNNLDAMVDDEVYSIHPPAQTIRIIRGTSQTNLPDSEAHQHNNQNTNHFLSEKLKKHIR